MSHVISFFVQPIILESILYGAYLYGLNICLIGNGCSTKLLSKLDIS